MYYINPDICKLNRIFDQHSRKEYLRLDLNENPKGLDQTFIDKVLSNIDSRLVAQYPETDEFTQTLADSLGVNKDEICLTNGSAEGVRFIIEAFSRPGGEVLSVEPSYAMYGVFSNMYGRKHVTVSYEDDLTFDIDKFIRKINPNTDIVIVLNPNNPMGDVYSDEDMTRIIEAAKKNEATVLIDEAYFYFYPHSFTKFALENEYVFITRTFSKLFSMAGCRLGYVIGKADGIKMVQKLCTPHNVNAFAMEFASAIIKTDGMIESMVTKQLEGKKYLVETLREHGYEVNAKEGNFVFIRPKGDAEELVRRMKSEKNILIKVYNGIGEMGKCLRVSTGETEQMQIFVKALLDLEKND